MSFTSARQFSPPIFISLDSTPMRIPLNPPPFSLSFFSSSPLRRVSLVRGSTECGGWDLGQSGEHNSSHCFVSVGVFVEQCIVCVGGLTSFFLDTFFVVRMSTFWTDPPPFDAVMLLACLIFVLLLPHFPTFSLHMLSDHCITRSPDSRLCPFSRGSLTCLL